MELELKNLSFRYPYTQIDVLNCLSWKIKSGRLIFLYAPEGRGKTTLCKILAGRYNPLEGQILLDGAEQTDLPPRERNAAYTDESFMFFPRRSVLYNFAYPLKVRGMGRSERLGLSEEMLRGAGLLRLKRQKVKNLSYTEKLDLMISRLFTVKRDIILFDEILKGADAKDAAAQKIESLALGNTEKIIIFASAEAGDAELFKSAEPFTLDCGKIFKGVNIDEPIAE